MRIHCYSHDIPADATDAFAERLVGEILAYLRLGGREEIACWSHQVENTAWQGGHPLLYPGASLTYRLSRN